MKSKRLLLMLLLALCAPWAAFGQETLTVCDGTTTNSTIPFYGLYADTQGAASECVIPSSELEPMDGGQITAMKFYISSAAGTAWSGTHQVYIGEVDATTLTGITGPSAFTVVKTASFDATGTELTVEFDQPYAYEGGNLLIGTYVSVAGNYKSASFKGVSQTENTGWYRSGASSTGNGVKFLPKTTFTYTAGTPSSCAKPESLEASNVTSNSATLTWTGGSGTYNVDYKKASDAEWTSLLSNTSLTTTSLTGLDANTDYQVRVQSVCDGNEVSGYRSTSFTTECEAITTFPWNEDFEDYNSGNFTDPCWVNEHISGNGTYIFKIYTYSNGDNSTHQLQLPDMSSGTLTKLVLPEMTLPDDNYQFAIDVYRNTNSSSYAEEGIRVYVSTNGEIEGATELAFISRNYTVTDDNLIPAETASGWYTYELPIGISGTCYIILRGESKYGSSTYMDNFKVEEMPSCLKPTDLAADDITTNSAELSWTANSGETAWTLYYKKSADENYTEVADATNPYVLEGLDAATAYDYYVVANCSATDQSEPSAVYSFTTECEIFSAYPYTENFDSYTAGNNVLPSCWNYINTTTYSSYQGCPKVYSSGSQSSPNCLYFYSYYSSYGSYDPQPQYAILPEMESLAGKQITLWAKGYNTSSTFKIGTMTDPADASTFSKIAEQALTTSYQEFIYNVPAENTATYIAIMIDAADADRYANSVYIDDITINLPPACPKPTDLAYSNVTAHTAQLSWTENGEATAWQICLNDDEDNPIDADSNPFTLEDLEDNTAYTAKVRSNCGDEQSEWSSTTVSFTTPIACPAPTGLAVSDITGHEATLNWTGTSEGYDVMYRTAAYADGFDEHFNTNSIPSGWTQYRGLVDEVVAGTAELSSASAWDFSSSYALGAYHAKLNIFGDNRNYWLVTPEITLNSGTDLSFDLALTAYNSNNAASGECTDDRFVVLVYANETWNILREWNNSGSNDVYNNIATTGENVSISLANFVNQTVKIAFYGESTEYGGDNDLHIDNVCVGTQHAAGEWQTAAEALEATTYTLTGLNPETDYEVKVVSNCEGETAHETSVVGFTTDVACMAPTGLTAEAGNYTAELSWTSDATAWQIQVGEDEPIDVNENPYTLENLDPETEYSVVVRANCGDDGYSEWSDVVYFTTLEGCPVPTDLAVSNITSNSADLAWTGYTDSYNVSYRTKAYMDGIEEGFGTSIPSGWEMYTGLLENGTATMSSTTWGWSFGENNGVFDNHARVNIYGNYQRWLVLPAITIPTGAGFSFDMALTAYSGSNVPEPDTDGTDDKFMVLISTDNMETWTTLREWNNEEGAEYVYNNIANTATGESVSIDLSAYAGQSVRIAFYGESTTSNADNNLHIDNVAIGVPVAAGEWQNVTAEETSASLTELTPNTEYEVKVQGVCGETTTEWTEIVSFTTLMPSFTKEITKYTGDKDHYYLIASPIGTVAPGDVTNMLENDYDLYSFDQTGDSDGKEWFNYENEEFTLESGKGYLYANSGTETSETVILTFTGVPCTDGTVTLSKDDDAYFPGWNLIGNPFAETAYIDRSFYAMNADGTELIGPGATTNPIAAMEGVFVIAETDGEELTFTTTEPVTGSSLALNVTRNRGNVIDRALVRFGSDRSLPKFQLRETSTKVYIPQEGKDYAVVSAGNVGELPVNFKAEKNGSYTMSFTSEAVEFSYLHLIDNMTGNDVDLLKTPSYNFDALTTDYASRFKLVFATGNATGDDFAFFSNGSFVINNEGEATLQIIDLLGRILNSETINGCANVNVDATPGVYMLRLINGNDVKVQKVVVR